MSDRETYEKWVREHHAAVYRAAYRVLRHEADAMEVTQQVFLDALRNVGRVAAADDAGRVLRWRAVKTALARIREEQARRRRESSSDAAWHGTAAESPELPAARSEEHVALARGLDRLPDDLRTAIALRFQDGLTFAQIGEALACSSSHAHERVRRGLTGLRRFLTGAGLALLAADARALEAQLATLDDTAIPGHLAPRLLDAGTAATFGVGTTLLVAALFIGSAIGIAALGQGDRPGFGDPGLAPPNARVASLEPALDPVDPDATESDPAAALRRAVSTAASTPPRITPTAARPVVRGRVVDTEHRPLAGFAVEARSLDQSGKGSPVIGGRTTTGSDGTFSIALPPPPPAGESWALLARYESMVLCSEGVLVRSDRAPPEVVLRVTEPIDERAAPWTLELVLRTDDGAPLADVPVAAHRRIGRGSHRVFSDPEARGRTNAHGVVRLTGATQGSKEVRLHPDAFPWSAPTLDVEVRDVFVHEERTVFDPRDLGGLVVLPDGRPVPDAVVIATGGGRARTDGAGRFRLDDVGPAVLDVEVDVSPYPTTVRTDVATGRDDIVLTLRPTGALTGSISGRAYDARTGAALSVPYDADVRAIRVDADLPLDTLFGDVLPNHALLFAAQQIDIGTPPPAAESFRIDGLEPARYVVRLELPGLAPAFLGPFDLARRPVVDDVVARLAAPGTVVGRVVDATGAPCPNAYLMVTGLGPISRESVTEQDVVVRTLGGRGAYLPRTHARTDADGRFRLSGLPVGLSLRLAALHPSHDGGTTGPFTLGSAEVRDVADVRLGEERER